jgi:hypothetical protein
MCRAGDGDYALPENRRQPQSEFMPHCRSTHGVKLASVLAALLGCLSLLLMPARTHAYMVTGESIEWVLATSERVVVGKAVSVDSIKGLHGKAFQAVTIAISRTLKGKAAERETFVLPGDIARSYALQWIEDGGERLFFLNRNEPEEIPIPADKPAWALRTSGRIPSAVLLGKSNENRRETMRVFTCDFDMLTDKDAILNFVEKTVKAMPKNVTPKSYTLETPGESAASIELSGGSAVLLVVPMDAKLETRGQEWCKSKAADERQPWSKSEAANERYKGALILRNFKSDRNITILKSLLDDPANTEAWKYSGGPEKPGLQLVYRKTAYYVRQAAYTSLNKLGVKVAKPLLSVLLEGHDEPDADIGEDLFNPDDDPPGARR